MTMHKLVLAIAATAIISVSVATATPYQQPPRFPANSSCTITSRDFCSCQCCILFQADEMYFNCPRGDDGVVDQSCAQDVQEFESHGETQCRLSFPQYHACVGGCG